MLIHNSLTCGIAVQFSSVCSLYVHVELIARTSHAQRPPCDRSTNMHLMTTVGEN